jgi:hypothetical protein
MLKRLERDAAKADLAAVESLLAARTEAEDPVGWLQFSQRREQLERELADLEQAPSTNAEVGLFFGGRPVIGSYGIIAEFGAKALEEFQTLVSSTSAAQERPLGARGPVPQRDTTQLLLTDVARGSFGFILQKTDKIPLVDSSLKDVIGMALDLVYRVASPDEEAFESVAEAVDDRVLGSLRQFFKILDDAGATVRLVEDRREFTLERKDVELARERTETLRWDDRERDMRGTLYVLPDSRRFELHPEGGGDALKGSIAPNCLERVTGGGAEVLPDIIGTMRTVRLREREVVSHGREPKRSYILIAVNDLLPQIEG